MSSIIRHYFYCAFYQQSSGAMCYFSGVTGTPVSYTSPDFLAVLCKQIAEIDKDPSISDRLVIQSLSPLD